MLARGDELLTSYLTVGEAITQPKQLNNAMLEKSYLNFFSGGSVEWNWLPSAWTQPSGMETFEVGNAFGQPTRSSWLALPPQGPICS